MPTTPHERPEPGYTSAFHLLVAKGHGVYALFGGLWPLLHMQSFEAVTGPKDDHWLVRSVAGILLVLGAVLLHDAFHGHVARSVRFLAAGISGVLAIVALVSSIAGFISWLYFFDGLLHLAFTGAWVVGTFAQRRRTATRRRSTAG